MYQFDILLFAWLIIIIDLFLLFVNRENKLLLLLNFFIFFFNYSICVGEYIANNTVIAKNFLHSTRYGNLYANGLILLFVFDCIRLFFFRRKFENRCIHYKSNAYLFYIIFFFLVYVGLFEVNREESLMYEVKIKPLYEYSTLFFILLIFYCGNSYFRNLIMHLLVVFFVIQDVYYGGRVTAIQLILLFLIMKYDYVLKFKYILMCFPIAILLFTVVGAYRMNYTFDFSLVGNTFDVIKTTWFVQDTAVYAFFASVTHINAWYCTDYSMHFLSFLAFVSSIFLGSKASSLFNFPEELPKVSEIASQYHWNVGGGMIFTWYYFWGGIWGMCILSFLTFYALKRLLQSNKSICVLMAVVVVLTLPRWYLYSPLSFWRSSFFLFPILFFFFEILNKTIKRLKKDS